MIFILITSFYRSYAQQYCYIMEDTRTHPTLGYYIAQVTGSGSTGGPCPGNTVNVVQYSDNMHKPANQCYAQDPWSVMISQGFPGTYRNCRVGTTECGFIISAIAIVNCPLDNLCIFIIIAMATIGFISIAKKPINAYE